MSDTLTVRDHSKPCEHGERIIRHANGNEGHNTGHFIIGVGSDEGVWCPGGREIVLRWGDRMSLDDGVTWQHRLVGEWVSDE